jgi:hypothetical protein
LGDNKEIGLRGWEWVGGDLEKNEVLGSRLPNGIFWGWGVGAGLGVGIFGSFLSWGCEVVRSGKNSPLICRVWRWQEGRWILSRNMGMKKFGKGCSEKILGSGGVVPNNSMQVIGVKVHH